MDEHNATEAMRDPERYRPIVEFLDRIIQGSAQLTWRELEIIGLVVANLIGSDFCSDLRHGMIETLPASQVRERSLDDLTAFAGAIVQNPRRIDASQIEQLRSLGWTDQTIEDVIGWVCILQMYSVMDHAFGFDGLPREVFTEIAEGTVHGAGYLPSFEYFLDSARSQVETATA